METIYADADKSVLREKFIVLSAHVIKEKEKIMDLEKRLVVA